MTIEDILKSESLPTLPEVAMRVLEIAQQAEPDMEDLVNAVKADPAIAGRILKAANSALFGVRYRAASIETAIPLLGINLVRMLVIGFTLSASRTQRPISVRNWYQLLWKNSLYQAATAETLAHFVAEADAADWFLAGLLQDIGRLAMLAADEENYILNVLSSIEDTDVEQLEHAAYGFTHTDVGLQLCRQWRMGDEFIDAIATHHDTSEFVVAGDSGLPSLATTLKTASLVVDYFEHVVGNRAYSRNLLDKLLMVVFGVAPDEITEVLADIDARATSISTMFAVDIGHGRSLERILEDAQDLLSEIAAENHLRLLKSAAAPINTANSIEQLRDPLTQVYGQSFLEVVSSECERSQTVGQNIGVIFLDIDNFTSVNAHHCSQFGDEALRRIAGVTKQVVRPEDVVIRFGGDEFLVFLPDAVPDLVARIARRLHSRITEIRLSCTEDIVISASIGAIALHPDRRPITLDTLIQEAQKATQKSRTLGGNQFSVFQRVAGKLSPLQINTPSVSAR